MLALLLAASLSIDNLIVGFALGAYNVPVVLAITAIAVVVLICVGAAIASGLF